MGAEGETGRNPREAGNVRRRRAEETRRVPRRGSGGPGAPGLGEGAGAAAHLRGGAAAPRTRGSSGRPPRPAAGGSGPAQGPGTWGRGAAVSNAGAGAGAGARARALGPTEGGSLARRVPEFGDPRRLGAGGGPRLPVMWEQVPTRGWRRSVGSRGSHRLSAGKPPQSPAASAPPAKASRGRRPPQSEQAAVLSGNPQKPSLTCSTSPSPRWLSLPALQSDSRPPKPVSVRHYPTIPPAQGHAVGPALLPSSRCAEAARPVGNARAYGARLLPTPPSQNTSSSDALAPVGADGLPK